MTALLLIGAVSAPFIWLRIAFVALFTGALIWSVLAVTRRRRPRVLATLVATKRGLYREDRSSAVLLCEWGAPFGVSWLIGQDALLAFTTPREVRCIRVRMGGASMAAIEAVKRSAAPMTDASFEVLADSASLEAADALDLVRYCENLARGSSGRVLASGLRGERIVLEGTNLVVRYAVGAGGMSGVGLETIGLDTMGSVNDKLFDLSLPLEWRASTFNESGGAASTGSGASAMLFSALAVKQKGAEVVFVSPAQGDLRPPFDGPPARESRIAIDALLLSPIRRALSRAPQIRRSSPPTPRGPREHTA